MITDTSSCWAHHGKNRLILAISESLEVCWSNKNTSAYLNTTTIQRNWTFVCSIGIYWIGFRNTFLGSKLDNEFPERSSIFRSMVYEKKDCKYLYLNTHGKCLKWRNSMNKTIFLTFAFFSKILWEEQPLRKQISLLPLCRNIRQNRDSLRIDYIKRKVSVAWRWNWNQNQVHALDVREWKPCVLFLLIRARDLFGNHLMLWFQ